MVCTEQAASVNSLFQTYGRLFNFQYQSYLISYCVYTAATIDVRLAKQMDTKAAKIAADRLIVTLQMLETEAKQTPGIKRSIEIIRSHMPQDFCHVSSNAVKDVLGKESSIPRMQEIDGALIDPLLRKYESRAVSNSSGQINQSTFDVSTHGAFTEPHFPLAGALEESADPGYQLDLSWVDWNMGDLGGGFVPDIACWSPSAPSF